jgi:uncharacterized protein (TIGR02996 family)
MKSGDTRAVADFLVNMRPEERALMFALLENAADVDAACAYADWLEENGRHEAGARIRRLAPQSGDVLVLTYDHRSDIGLPPPFTGFHALEKIAAAVKERLDAHGRDVTVLIYPDNQTLEVVGEDGMRAAGWVRQERLAEAVAAEREACALAVEHHPRVPGAVVLRSAIAAEIRAREANDPIDEVRESLEGWPASAGFAPGVVAVDTPTAPTPVADIEEVADLARQHGEPFGRGGTVEIDSPGRHGA